MDCCGKHVNQFNCSANGETWQALWTALKTADYLLGVTRQTHTQTQTQEHTQEHTHPFEVVTTIRSLNMCYCLRKERKNK